MLRSAASKVMWIGRATVFVVGLAVVLLLTLAIVAQAADAARVPALKKGVVNTVKSMTTLVGSLTDPILKLDNNGSGPALQLEAGAGNAPLVVNADSGTATNLDADLLDGKEQSDFATGLANGSGTAANTDKLDGKDSSEFAAKTSEGWHEVQAFHYIFWTSFGAPHNTVGYYKDPVGIVHLKGIVRWNAPGGSALGGGCGGDNEGIFQLPAGYRPAAREVHPSLKNDTLSRIDIRSDGWVTFCDSRTISNGDWFSLDGISFRAAS